MIQTLYLGDNLTVLREPEGTLRGGFQVAYLDPPFRTGRRFKRSDASGLECYADPSQPEPYQNRLRLLLNAIKPLMASNGSVLVHCDWRTSAHLRLLLDEVFGAENYVNELIWSYRTGGTPQRGFARKHDTIHLYALDARQMKWLPGKEKSYVRHRYGFGNIQLSQDEGGWFREANVRDVIEIPALRGNSPEYAGYPTQKPIALMRHLLARLAEPGDLVLDPFCGSATTLVAARELGLQGVGVDDSRPAVSTALWRAVQEEVSLNLHGAEALLDGPQNVALDDPVACQDPEWTPGRPFQVRQAQECSHQMRGPGKRWKVDVPTLVFDRFGHLALGKPSA